MTSQLSQQFLEQRLFENHFDELSDLELLTLALRRGVSTQRAFQDAQRVLSQLGTATQIAEASCPELRSAGLTLTAALALRAAATLFQRARRSPLRKGQKFTSSIEVFDHFQPRVEGLQQECFWSVLLDGKNRLIRMVRVSTGTLTSSLAHPREVYRPAIREAAAGILFVHNHPSGDPEPSPEDLQITRRLVEVGKIVGIRAVDHVIIGARSHFSFADAGLL